MLRRLRHSSRDKLGRALQDYVLDELRGLLRAQEDAQATARAQAESRLAGELTAVRDELAQARDELRGAEERLQSALRAWERRQRRDLLTVTDVEAAQSSAHFFGREMDRGSHHRGGLVGARHGVSRAWTDRAPRSTPTGA